MNRLVYSQDAVSILYTQLKDVINEINGTGMNNWACLPWLTVMTFVNYLHASKLVYKITLSSLNSC